MHGRLPLWVRLGFAAHPPPTSAPAAFRQDISAIDVVAGLDDLESELVHIAGVIAQAPVSAGSLHQSVQITTAVVVSASNSLRIRLPDDVVTSLGASLAVGFAISLDGHMWRFNSKAQPSAWDAGSVSVGPCTQTSLVSAAAVGNTQVVLTFSAALDPSTVLAAAFSIDGTVTATLATANGATVTLTTPVIEDGSHTVNVAVEVKDTQSQSVGPASAAFTVGGGVFISEIDYDQPSNDSAEFVEIVNAGNAPFDLTGVRFVRMNQTGSTIGAVTTLSGSLAAGARLVIGNVSGAAFAFDGPADQMQNGGADAVALVGSDNTIISGVIYEAASADATLPFTFDNVSLTVSEATTAADTGEGSLCREAAADGFASCETATPGT